MRIDEKFTSQVVLTLCHYLFAPLFIIYLLSTTHWTHWNVARVGSVPRRSHVSPVVRSVRKRAPWVYMMEGSRKCAICSHLLQLPTQTLTSSQWGAPLSPCFAHPTPFGRPSLRTATKEPPTGCCVKLKDRQTAFYNLQQWTWSSFEARELCLWLPHRSLPWGDWSAALLCGSTRLDSEGRDYFHSKNKRGEHLIGILSCVLRKAHCCNSESWYLKWAVVARQPTHFKPARNIFLLGCQCSVLVYLVVVFLFL